jgi:hypothetical protein
VEGLDIKCLDPIALAQGYLTGEILTTSDEYRYTSQRKPHTGPPANARER